jgi:hypothetical protein
MRYPTVFIYILAFIISIDSYCYSADSASKSSYPANISTQQNTLTPFPDKAWMRKIAKRHEFEEEGRELAKNGKYDEAILKFKAATDPAVLNNESDKVHGLWAICDIYKYQGKLNEALELHEKYILPLNPKKEQYIEKRLELVAMIRARDTKNTAPIYQYINYIKTKYADYLPPKKYTGTYGSEIDDIIHLYDYLRDYDTGIAFMNEIINFINTQKDHSYQTAYGKHVEEYARVKCAWELDKQTGQHGHLQEVIRTSDVISW